MGNIFSNTDNDSENNIENTETVTKYNLTDIKNLSNNLDKIRSSNNTYNLLGQNFNFDDFESINKNLNLDTNQENLNVEEFFINLLKNIQKNITFNHLKDNWPNNLIDENLETSTVLNFKLKNRKI